MKKLLFYYLGGLVLLLAAFACHDDDDDDDVDVPGTVLATNKWIKENMELYYYWNDELPRIDQTRESDPEKYFQRLLYKDDKWSWITDDYASLQADYDGEPVTMGYDPTFYTFSDEKSVFMVVNYVYPQSAAADAGLKRGDIILSINQTDLDTSNYYDLFSGKVYSVQLGEAVLQGQGVTIYQTDVSLDLTARITVTDPAISYRVIDTLGYKVGYLAYVEFVAGDNNGFLSTLDQIFNAFKSEGISDLVVDLRYNPGGDKTAAGHLASVIAPAAIVNARDVMVNLKYNDELEAYLQEEYPEELTYRFSKLAANINLQRVYFLTTRATASASELVITGLDPYMEVVQIGEATYGKYGGAWVLPDDDEKWAVVPVVMKYSNANGYTDFAEGLIPDFPMTDDVVFSVPFGDTADPMIKRAIEDIAGIPQSVATRSESDFRKMFKKLIPENKEVNRRRNLYVPVTGDMRCFMQKANH